MTIDTATRREPETGERQPRPEIPQPPYAPAPAGTAEPPPVEEGVSRPPFPTRGDVDTEC